MLGEDWRESVGQKEKNMRGLKNNAGKKRILLKTLENRRGKMFGHPVRYKNLF